MLRYFLQITIVVSVLAFGYLFYEFQYNDSSESWINFDQPKPADFTSLEEEEAILEKLDQVRIDASKPLDRDLFDKPNIFQVIE